MASSLSMRASRLIVHGEQSNDRPVPSINKGPCQFLRAHSTRGWSSGCRCHIGPSPLPILLHWCLGAACRCWRAALSALLNPKNDIGTKPLGFRLNIDGWGNKPGLCTTLNKLKLQQTGTKTLSPDDQCYWAVPCTGKLFVHESRRSKTGYVSNRAV